VSREGGILQGINSGSDPSGERRTPRYIVRTPRVGLGPPGIQSGPPGLVPALHVCKLDPWDGVWTPVMGLGHPQRGPKDPRGRTVLTRVRTQSGADLSVYASAPRPGRDPMLPRGLLRVT
jgi:hypothetical protein